MKVKYCVIFGVALIAAAHSAPAKEEKATSESSEVEEVPKSPSYGDQPIIDTGVISGPFFFNPFGGLFQGLDAMMQRMRQQMAALLNRLPSRNASDEVVPFPEFAALPNFGGIDLGKGNTTSVTKVINGHKVVINETEYKQEGEHGGAFFKVRIIDVEPEGTQTTEKDVELVPPMTNNISRDRESVENTVDNEIQKSNEEPNFENLETFDEVDMPFSRQHEKFDYLEPFESVDNNEVWHPQKVIDLSQDTRVNDIMARAGVTPNPDAEFINPNAETFATFNNHQENLVDESKTPRNLNRDVYVNELLAEEFESLNPDAEVFDPIEEELKNKNSHKFDSLIMPR